MRPVIALQVRTDWSSPEFRMLSSLDTGEHASGLRPWRPSPWVAPAHPARGALIRGRRDETGIAWRFNGGRLETSFLGRMAAPQDCPAIVNGSNAGIAGRICGSISVLSYPLQLQCRGRRRAARRPPWLVAEQQQRGAIGVVVEWLDGRRFWRGRSSSSALRLLDMSLTARVRISARRRRRRYSGGLLESDMPGADMSTPGRDGVS